MAGALRQVKTPETERAEEGRIQITWQDNSGSGNALAGDRVMVLAMAGDGQFFAGYNLEGSERSREEHWLELDEALKKEPAVHIYPSMALGCGGCLLSQKNESSFSRVRQAFEKQFVKKL